MSLALLNLDKIKDETRIDKEKSRIDMSVRYKSLFLQEARFNVLLFKLFLPRAREVFRQYTVFMLQDLLTQFLLTVENTILGHSI